MLEIHITTCTDPEYEGVWRFEKNQIYFGHPEGDISPVGMLPSNAFMLEVLPDFLQAHPGPIMEYWLLNGKRATKSRKLKVGDQVQVGEVTFKVTAAEYREVQSKKQILDARLKALVEQQSPLLELVHLLNVKSK